MTHQRKPATQGNSHAAPVPHHYASVAAIFCFLLCLGVIYLGMWMRDHSYAWLTLENGFDPTTEEVQKLQKMMPTAGELLFFKGILLAPCNIALLFVKRNPFFYICHWSNIFVLALCFFPIGVPMLKAWGRPEVKRAYGMRA